MDNDGLEVAVNEDILIQGDVFWYRLQKNIYGAVALYINEYGFYLIARSE